MKNTIKNTTTATAEISTLTQAQREALGKALSLKKALDLGFASIEVRYCAHSQAHNAKGNCICRKVGGNSYDLGKLSEEVALSPLDDLCICIDREPQKSAEGFKASAYIIGTFDYFNNGFIDVRFNTIFEHIIFTNINKTATALDYAVSEYRDYIEAFRKLCQDYTIENEAQAVENFKAWLMMLGAEAEDFEQC